MEPESTTEDVFDIGVWVGRRQGFALVAGRCSAADAEILFEIRENKLFRSMEPTWEDFCTKRLGIDRSYADRRIRQFQQLGPDFCRLNSFTRIRPADYRLVAGALTDGGLSYDGDVIPLEPGNAPKLTQAVEALRSFDGDPESVTEIYLLDERRVLRGAISLARLVVAQPETRLAVLAEPRVLSCPADLPQNDLAELFDKYNLHALPVVDAQGRMVGVVQADHVISFLRDKL